MIWAINDKGEKVKSSPKEKAKCPICNGEVMPKCGVVKNWHWAHKTLIDCDLWAEPESEWHLSWKNNFPMEQQEIVIEKEGIKHRADIYLPYGKVIELQNSPISPDDICDREKFYEDMIWLLNGDTLGKNFEIIEKPSYFTFHWKNPPQSFFHSENPIYIDISGYINELDDMAFDVMERIGIIYEELKLLIKGDPHKFDFYRIKYLQDKESQEVYRKYEIWSNLSREHGIYESRQKMFKGKSIFFIKKLYKKIPCAGWGYLMSKEEFLNDILPCPKGQGI